MTSAVLCQFHDGRLLLLHDWVREGNPGELVEPIYNESVLLADSPREFLLRDRPRCWSAMLKAPVPDRLVTRNAPATWVVPAHHEDKYTNVGLMQAIRAIPADLRLGGGEAGGQVKLQELLGRSAEDCRRWPSARARNGAAGRWPAATPGRWCGAACRNSPRKGRTG